MIPMTTPAPSSLPIASCQITAKAFRAVCAVSLASAALLFLCSAQAGAPRALPEGALPPDNRLEPPKDLDGYFPFVPSTTPQEWERRAEQVRSQTLVALGLWPAPTKTPLNAVVHGRIDRDDYTVEKVYFEAIPGFFVTGNLYRPKGKTGPLPAVLCPHGHWDNGRFMDYGPNRIRQEIVQGAERFEEGGRSVLQARCVQLARMGCVVFHYDMIGYADSVQISNAIAHGFAKQRPDMSNTERWGFFSPQAESHLQSIMGLQTWSSIRALDFLTSLPEVDAGRIAVTGASGGGTQTFILGALDPRPAVVFPAVMVSTAMQGGCTCENACLLRVDTGNVEFAAMFAPKPQGLTAADDWTREMETKGFPELQKHYAMLGAKDKVMLKPLLHFGHNYNYVSRAAMYQWLNKHLKLGLSEPILEQDYKRLSQQEMSVWDSQHPRPESGPEVERKIVHWLTEDARAQLQRAHSSSDEYRKLLTVGWQAVLGRNLAQAGTVALDVSSKKDRTSYSETVGLLRNAAHREALPVVLLEPKKGKGHAVLWTFESGKSGLFTSALADRPEPNPEVKKLLDAGTTVVGVDLLHQGEFLKDAAPLARTPRVKNPREAAAYTFGYNRTVFAQRVHDILSVVKYLRDQEPALTRIDLVGLDKTGPIVLAAAAQAGDAINGVAANTGGFRFLGVTDIHDPYFLPGGAKYGDLPGVLSLIAPHSLWIAGEAQEPAESIRKIYAKANAENRFVSVPSDSPDLTAGAVKWLSAAP